jgi:hypothetical protein
VAVAVLAEIFDSLDRAVFLTFFFLNLRPRGLCGARGSRRWVWQWLGGTAGKRRSGAIQWWWLERVAVAVAGVGRL